ncbi:hypothetical protein [Shewanella algae]|uniref:hypothetical protein n=1 Tax=Shewanella algae TaxID=38313 RepID=UPI0031F545B4
MNILLLIDACLIAIYSIAAHKVVPVFVALFSGWEGDAEFPLMTGLVIDSYPFWSVVLIVPFAIWLIWGRNGKAAISGRRAGLWASATLLVLLVAWLPAVLWGLYGPIFLLSSNGAA